MMMVNSYDCARWLKHPHNFYIGEQIADGAKPENDYEIANRPENGNRPLGVSADEASQRVTIIAAKLQFGSVT